MHAHLHDGTPPMPSAQERARWPLPLTAFALAVGCFMLLAGPLLGPRAPSLDGVLQLSSAGAPSLATLGLVLLGAAALALLIVRLVRDVAEYPYASIAPVLAVFAGLMLNSLRSPLPLPGLGADQVGLSVIVLALLGGALTGRQEPTARALGWTLALLPAVGLTLALMAVRGDSSPLATLTASDPALRAYLAVLSISSLALALVGIAGRRLVDEVHASRPSAPMPRLPRETPSSAPRPSTPSHGGYGPNTPYGFAQSYVPARAQATPTGLVRAHAVPSLALALDEQEILLLSSKKRALVRGVLWLVGLSAAGLTAYYALVVQPARQQQQALERARSLARMQAAQERANQRELPAQGEELSQRMERYLQQQRDRPETASGASASRAAFAPVVTSLRAEPQVAPAPERSQPAELESRARRTHRRGVRLAEPATRPSPRAEAAEPAAKPSTRLAPTEGGKPATMAEPPAAKTQNERELDLDALLEKSLESGKGSGVDDPILGL